MLYPTIVITPSIPNRWYQSSIVVGIPIFEGMEIKKMSNLYGKTQPLKLNYMEIHDGKLSYHKTFIRCS